MLATCQSAGTVVKDNVWLKMKASVQVSLRTCGDYHYVQKII